jgi:hypothetical protein
MSIERNQSDTLVLPIRTYSKTGTPKNSRAKTNEYTTAYVINNQPKMMTPLNNQTKIITALGISSGIFVTSPYQNNLLSYLIRQIMLVEFGNQMFQSTLSIYPLMPETSRLMHHR